MHQAVGLRLTLIHAVDVILPVQRILGGLANAVVLPRILRRVHRERDERVHRTLDDGVVAAALELVRLVDVARRVHIELAGLERRPDRRTVRDDLHVQAVHVRNCLVVVLLVLAIVVRVAVHRGALPLGVALQDVRACARRLLLQLPDHRVRQRFLRDDRVERAADAVAEERVRLRRLQRVGPAVRRCRLRLQPLADERECVRLRQRLDPLVARHDVARVESALRNAQRVRTHLHTRPDLEHVRLGVWLLEAGRQVVEPELPVQRREVHQHVVQPREVAHRSRDADVRVERVEVRGAADLVAAAALGRARHRLRRLRRRAWRLSGARRLVCGAAAPAADQPHSAGRGARDARRLQHAPARNLLCGDLVPVATGHFSCLPSRESVCSNPRVALQSPKPRAVSRDT